MRESDLFMRKLRRENHTLKSAINPSEFDHLVHWLHLRSFQSHPKLVSRWHFSNLTTHQGTEDNLCLSRSRDVAKVDQNLRQGAT